MEKEPVWICFGVAESLLIRVAGSVTSNEAEDPIEFFRMLFPIPATFLLLCVAIN